uniref:Uncharacterized protein n=1 Tax=Schizaphis graminum TaxID=13262 RepID=A0A2S2NEX9_SCHGA
MNKCVSIEIIWRVRCARRYRRRGRAGNNGNRGTRVGRTHTRRAVPADESRMNSNGVRPALGQRWGEARGGGRRTRAATRTGPCVREFASVLARPRTSLRAKQRVCVRSCAGRTVRTMRACVSEVKSSEQRREPVGGWRSL